MDLSLDDIQQLSPDDASFKAAKGLVIPAKWPLLAVNDSALWGECQGSGSKPYQVQVDRVGPAFKCSCPSRKFPCKHGLALLLLHAQHGDKFSTGDAPTWVTDWLASRQDKAEKKTAKKIEAEAVPVDPAAKAKREATRKQRMLGGLEELEHWLKDQIRQGLAQLGKEAKLGQQLAAHMVDAQLPGLANRIRQWPALINRNNQWPEMLLAEFGELQLLIDGARLIDELPTATQADINAALGLAIDKENVIADGEKISDDWLVLGQRIYEEERLWVRRVWLRARTSNRFAFLLDFAHGTRQFEHNFFTGSCVTMTLAFYPGNHSLRALVVNTPTPAQQNFNGELPLAHYLQHLSDQLAANPWQWPQPLIVSNALVHCIDGNWFLIAQDGETFSLELNAENSWQLLAESGGKPLHLFGEWENNKLQPLGVWRDQFLWSHVS